MVKISFNFFTSLVARVIHASLFRYTYSMRYCKLLYEKLRSWNCEAFTIFQLIINCLWNIFQYFLWQLRRIFWEISVTHTFGIPFFQFLYNWTGSYANDVVYSTAVETWGNSGIYSSLTNRLVARNKRGGGKDEPF